MIAYPRPGPNCTSELLGSPLSWLSPVGLALPMAMTLGTPLPWQLCCSRWCQLISSPSCLHWHLIPWISSFASMHILPSVSSPPSSCLQICEQPFPWHRLSFPKLTAAMPALPPPDGYISGLHLTYLTLGKGGEVVSVDNSWTEDKNRTQSGSFWRSWTVFVWIQQSWYQRLNPWGFQTHFLFQILST